MARPPERPDVDPLLTEVDPTAPETCLAAAGLVLVVALAAAYVPAFRAMRIDPSAALRVTGRELAACVLVGDR